MVERTRLPPSLRSLQVFEAVARHRNVTHAAEALCVSQPAVTQQLRVLERFVGAPLVRAERRGVTLTPIGNALAARVARAFDDLGDALAEAAGRARGGPGLTVALLTTLAQRWLIPRLAAFQELHPDIDVRLFTTSRLVDLEREDVDVAIRVGDGHWPGCRADFVSSNDLFPVASPLLLASRPLSRAEDLARHVLIQVDAPPRQDDWARWLAPVAAGSVQPAGRMEVASSAQALEAAAAGLGVAMAHAPFVELDLAAGRLVRPFPQRLAEPDAFYLVSAESSAMLPRVRAFRDWLLSCLTAPAPTD